MAGSDSGYFKFFFFLFSQNNEKYREEKEPRERERERERELKGNKEGGQRTVKRMCKIAGSDRTKVGATHRNNWLANKKIATKPLL